MTTKNTTPKKLYIKNMVCNRCIMAVEQVLNDNNIPFNTISLGQAILSKNITETEKETLKKDLELLGFELIDDKKSLIIARIKTLIIDLAQNQNNAIKQNLSDILSNSLPYDYPYLSQLFSEVEGTTIEKYYIAQKIEKVKELLVYNELSLSQIAEQLNYSSVAYLSNQFKKVTGLSPSHFKQIGQQKRKPLDQV